MRASKIISTTRVLLLIVFASQVSCVRAQPKGTLILSGTSGSSRESFGTAVLDRFVARRQVVLLSDAGLGFDLQRPVAISASAPPPH